MKCPNCGGEIPEDDPVRIEGTARVEGFATIESFREVGVEWTPRESWDERVECPECRQLVPL